MSDEANVSRVARVMASVFGVSAASITASTVQHEIEGWDSLSHIHLVAALEAEFEVTFTTDQALSMTSTQAILTALAEQGVG